MSNPFKNTQICPETVVQIVLEARLIPDRASVSTRLGDKVLLLRHNLTLRHKGLDKDRDVEIEGFFLISENGDITQIIPDLALRWHIAAEDLVDGLQSSWRTEP